MLKRHNVLYLVQKSTFEVKSSVKINNEVVNQIGKYNKDDESAKFP